MTAHSYAAPQMTPFGFAALVLVAGSFGWGVVYGAFRVLALFVWMFWGVVL